MARGWTRARAGEDASVEFSELSISPADEQAAAAAREHWNTIAKPIGSLGLLEDAVVKIAALTGDPDVRLGKRAVVAMCADNGVVEEGVSQAGQEVTALVAQNMARGASSVCRMGAVAGVDVYPIDIGMAFPAEGVSDKHIARGTANMTQGPAMTRGQACAAIRVGMDEVARLTAAGYGVIATGEMGIGNTTTSSAVAAVLLGLPPAEVTGLGSGLSNEGLVRKVDAIERAIALNAPDPHDALDVLAKVGGFDIAGLVGVFLGGAVSRVPILVDGFISAVAALAAARMVPACVDAMIATHSSAEPAAARVLAELGLNPVIYGGLRLGEGTGAVCLLPMLDMALEVYNGTSFDGLGMEAYDAELVK